MILKRIIFSTLCIISIVGMISICGSSLVLAEEGWSDCPRGITNCAYPGKCRSYIDTNNDGICDHSQPAPQENANGDLSVNSTDTPEMSVKVDENIGNDSIDYNGAVIAGLDDSSSAVEGDVANGSNRLGYYLIPIIFIISILYGTSYLLSTRRIIKTVVHRRIWNVILLVATIISALLGLFLILGMDFGINVPIPFNSLFWHVEAGIAMGLIAVFHILWHWRYFQKMLKPAR